MKRWAHLCRYPMAKPCGSLCAVAMLAACAAPAAAPPAHPAPASTSPQTVAPQAPEQTGPAEVAIGDLLPDAQRQVRVRGVVSAVVGVRLVPPKVIFEVTDRTGTVTALISEQVQLSEGTRIEIVGAYKPMVSPMHDGPGDGPQENILVVDRYLALP